MEIVGNDTACEGGSTVEQQPTSGGTIERLYQDCHQPIQRYLERIVHPRETAEDLSQETFIKASQHWEQLDQVASVRGWLYRAGPPWRIVVWLNRTAKRCSIIGYTAMQATTRLLYREPMTDFDIHAAMAILRETMPRYEQPLVDAMGAAGQTPFHILIATILSLRTKDSLTAVVTPRLFAAADTPQTMLELSEERIAELIYPVGFYRTKAKSIRQVCALLIERHGGAVPKTLDELLALPGVGRKTANLVLTAGYGLPGICVDTHVHRICNRWGYIQTKDPEATEMALRAKLPPEYWLEINKLLVALGQNICHPTSPRCSICPVAVLCQRVGVTRSR